MRANVRCKPLKLSSRKQAGLVEGRLLRQSGKGPLEVRREDIESHVRWMEGQGCLPSLLAIAARPYPAG